MSAVECRRNRFCDNFKKQKVKEVENGQIEISEFEYQHQVKFKNNIFEVIIRSLKYIEPLLIQMEINDLILPKELTSDRGGKGRIEIKGFISSNYLHFL